MYYTVKIYDENLYYKEVKFEKSAVDGFYRREIIKLTQSQMQQLTGICQSWFSRHEKGRYSEKVHNEYIGMGVELWWDNLHNGDLAFLDKLLNSDWRKKLNEQEPGLVPVPVEV